MWTPNSAAAFGMIIGERLGGASKGGSPGEAAEMVATAVKAMVINLCRRKPDFPELLRREPPSVIEGYLLDHERTGSRREIIEPLEDAAEMGSGLLS